MNVNTAVAALLERMGQPPTLAGLPTQQVATLLHFMWPATGAEKPERQALYEELYRRHVQEAQAMGAQSATKVLDVVYLLREIDAQPSLWPMLHAYRDTVQAHHAAQVQDMDSAAIVEALEPIADKSRHTSADERTRRTVYLNALLERHPEARKAEEQWDEEVHQDSEEFKQGPAARVIAAVRDALK